MFSFGHSFLFFFLSGTFCILLFFWFSFLRVEGSTVLSSILSSDWPKLEGTIPAILLIELRYLISKLSYCCSYAGEPDFPATFWRFHRDKACPGEEAVDVQWCPSNGAKQFVHPMVLVWCRRFMDVVPVSVK